MTDYVIVYPKEQDKAQTVGALFAEPVTLAKIPLLMVHRSAKDDYRSIAAHPDVGGLISYPQDLGRIVIAWDRMLALGDEASASIRMNGWPAEDIGYPVYDRSRPGEQISWNPGVHYPTSQGRLVAVNMSLGPSDPRTPFARFEPINVATYIASQQVLPVVAAGNESQRADGRETMSAWAEAPWVMAVGATADPQGRQLAAYSSVGSPAVPQSGPDIMAYGISEVDDNLPGTSFAAPKITRFSGILASMVLTLKHEVQKLVGGPVTGIPRIVLGIIDTDIHWQHVPLQIPALPSFGVNTRNLQTLVSALQEMSVTLLVEPTPVTLSTLLTWAAEPMPAYAQFEVGAGFLSTTQIKQMVATFDGERFAWLFASPRPSSEVIGKFRGLTLFEADAVDELVSLWQQALMMWAVDLATFELIDGVGSRHSLAV